MTILHNDRAPGPQARRQYPWASLAAPLECAGQPPSLDSFTIFGVEQKQLSSSKRAAERRLGWAFRLQTVVQDGRRGVRVWRIR